MAKRWIMVNVFLLCLVGQGCHADSDEPLGWLIIPSIHLYTTIHTAPIVDQQYVMPDGGAAHLEGTAWVDEKQFRVVLAGHSPGTFSHLNELQRGERIIVRSHLDSYQFSVTQRHITHDTVHWLMPTEQFTLTLITCLDRGVTWLIVETEEVH